MSSFVDKEKVQLALREVADLSGNRAAQRGSISPADGAEVIALRIRNEIHIAMLNWATVEAFNAQVDKLQSQLEARQAWQPAKFAVKALVRDVVATLCRVTDPPGGDRQCLAQLVKTWSGKSASDLARETGATAKDVENGLQFLRERVPTSWGQGSPIPSNTEFIDLRESIRPIRDQLIAHALSYSSLDLKRDIRSVRDFLRLVAELSDAACIICNIQRDSLQDRWDSSFAEANAFWCWQSDVADPASPSTTSDATGTNP